jgi:hypothetical protein
MGKRSFISQPSRLDRVAAGVKALDALDFQKCMRPRVAWLPDAHPMVVDEHR